MAKYENIRALAKKQLQAVTESSDRWKAFLQTAAIAYAECRENQGVSHWAQLPHPQGECNPIFAERNTRRLQHCQCDNRQCGVKGIYPLSYRCHLYR